MCEPTTIAILGATAAAGTLQAVGQIQEGQAAKQAADYQSQVSKNNAQQATWAADDARSRGEQEVMRLQQQSALIKGNQRATAAARGVEVDTGSAANILQDTAGATAMDTLTIRTNAERQAVGYQNQSNEFLGDSQLQKAAGANARAGSYLAAGGTLLNTTATVSDRWYRYRGGYN